jgi:hypothetical protein
MSLNQFNSLGSILIYPPIFLLAVKACDFQNSILVSYMEVSAIRATHFSILVMSNNCAEFQKCVTAVRLHRSFLTKVEQLRRLGRSSCHLEHFKIGLLAKLTNQQPKRLSAFLQCHPCKSLKTCLEASFCIVMGRP